MSENFYSVSRIEGNIVVLENPDKSFSEFNISDLPIGIKEGNILKKDINGAFVIDNDEEKRRKERLLKLQDKIFGKF